MCDMRLITREYGNMHYSGVSVQSELSDAIAFLQRDTISCVGLNEKHPTLTPQGCRVVTVVSQVNLFQF